MTGFFASADFVRNVENTEINTHLKFTRTRKQLFPGEVSELMAIDSGYAFFNGTKSPLSQAIGLGLQGAVYSHTIDHLENFYKSYNCFAAIEVSQYCDFSLFSVLQKQGFLICESTNVLVLPLKNWKPENLPDNIQIKSVSQKESVHAADIIERGFANGRNVDESTLGLIPTFVAQPDSNCFIGYFCGNACSGGLIFFHDEIAFLGGASTLPDFRNNGLHYALILYRLNIAKEKGYDFAVVVTQPGSISQKNFQKLGFQIAYSRLKFIKNYS